MSTENTNTERPFFNNTSGVRYYVSAVSYDLVKMAANAVVERYRETGEPIDPPTYSVTTVAGDIEEHAHVHTLQTDKNGDVVLDDDGKPLVESSTLETEEDFAAWEAHDLALARMRGEQQAIQMEMWLDGVEFEVLPEWEAKRKKYGITVPKEHEAKRMHYLTTEVLKSAEDYMRAMEAVQLVSLQGIVPEDEIRALVNSFRSQLLVTAQEGIDKSRESGEDNPGTPQEEEARELDAQYPAE